MTVDIPYGTSFLSCGVPDSRLKAVLTSRLHELKAEKNGERIVVKKRRAFGSEGAKRPRVGRFA